MSISLKPVTTANRGDLAAIDAGPKARYWVHSYWYWHQQSLDNPNIVFRLIHITDTPAAVGMAAFGPAYMDEALTQVIEGAYELIHLVIDYRYHRKGIGWVVAKAVLQMLAAQPDCQRVLIAHHPDNVVSHTFFAKLGFHATDLQNYDGDPLFELARHEAIRLALGDLPLRSHDAA